MEMNNDHKLASSSPDQQQHHHHHHHRQLQQLRYLDGQQYDHPQQAGQMQQLVQPPGPPMGYQDDFFAHFDRATTASLSSSSIGRYQQQPQVMMQLQQSAQQQVPRRPSLTLGGPTLSGFGAMSTFHTSASGSTGFPPPQYQHHLHHQHPMRTVDRTNNFHTTIVASPMRAPPTNSTYARSSSSSIASLHRRQQQELNELREKERRLCALRQEQERLRRIKREQREAVGKAQTQVISNQQHRPGVDAGSWSCSSASVYTPSSISATRNTANTPSSTITITESSTGSSDPRLLPSPRPPSVEPAASANPIPDNKQAVNVPPATTVASSRPQGWFVCTLCKSRAFSSESDLADHQVICATNDVSAATAIRESLAAQEQAQARARAELRERLSSAKAQVAVLQKQIQQTQQQMVPMSQTYAGPTTVHGGTFSSNTSSQPMVYMPASNNKESSSINRNNKNHLESLGIEDVTRLAMQEMIKKTSVNETDDIHGSAVNATTRGLAPSKRTEHQKQPPPLMTALTSSIRLQETTAEFAHDEIVIGERLESPIPLGIPLDKDMLTPLHCFIREHCVQIFTASKIETEAPSKGKRRQVLMHQVGIRCPYCKGRPDKSACAPPAEGTHGNAAGPERGSVYYPSTIAAIYNGSMNLIQRHLQACPMRPTWVIARYNDLKRDEARSGSSKAYWVEAARRLGLYDTTEGIRYDPSLVDRTMSFHRHDGYPPAPSSASTKSDKLAMPPPGASEGFYSNESATTNGVNMEPSNELAAAAMHEAASQLGNPPVKPPLQPQSSTSGMVNPTTAPAGEEGNLVEPADRTLSTSFSYFIMSQMRMCHFVEADRLGKRKALPAGFPGLACRHCYGGFGSGRFFPSTLKTLSDTSKTLNVLHNHMMRCRKCPIDVRDSLTKLKPHHDLERARMKFGSQKSFFERIWGRLHGTGRSIGSVGAARSMATMCAPTVAQPQQPMQTTSAVMPPPPQRHHQPVVKPPATQMQQQQMQMLPPQPPPQHHQRPIGPPADNPLVALALLAGMKRKDRDGGEQEGGASSQEEKRSRASVA